MREKNSINIHSRWNILVFAGLCFLNAVLAAGCGGEYQSSGNQKNASGSAVSGDAIKGGKDPYESIYCSKDPMCNGRNYYEYTDKGIEQRTLKGGLLQTIPLGKYGIPIYVTKDEIFCITYMNENTNREKTQVWSIPIEKKPEGDVPHPEHASFILEDESVGWGGDFYADANQIVYITCYYSFKVFDRRTGKYVKLKNNPEDKKGMPNDITYIEDCMCDGYILFQCKYDGLYVYELGSDHLTLVDEMAHGAYISTGYGKKHQIIYERCDTCQPGKGKDAGEAPDHTASLYIYDCLTEEKQLFMKDEQWKEAYKKSGIYKDNMEYLDGYDFSWKSFFIDESILFLMDYENKFVFSINLEGDQTPHYERQLSEWLRKTGYEVTTFDHGRCYTLYEKDSDEEEEYSSISGYYDLGKNEFVETERV